LALSPSGHPQITVKAAQLQFGTRLIVDQDPPISGAFFTCSANGCTADYEATPELVARLKKGQMLQIQAINLAANAITFPLPLADYSGNSFRKVYDGPPTDPKVFEEQQRRRQQRKLMCDSLVPKVCFNAARHRHEHRHQNANSTRSKTEFAIRPKGRFGS
jgi:hypothetical protein